MNEENPTGVLCLVGGGEWRGDCVELDQELLRYSRGDEVLVLPTAAAYELPERAVATAKAHFFELDASVRGVMVLDRSDAMNRRYADEVAESSFIYLSGGSPLHLRSVLKDSLVWGAMLYAYKKGAVLAGSSAGAMVLSDPMADPRGGAFTVGLGLISPVAFVPHFDNYPAERRERTLRLAPPGIPVLGVAEGAAVMRMPDGSLREIGKKAAEVFLDGKATELEALAENMKVDVSQAAIYRH
ncbi:cyanophycinase [Ferrithrix thermotolerans DSM 19514]|uniref:Cyanophycinase n=1 Tax=Ferrithrix thermotolerans DSM 19514 TaxID=1121881 RepID=A0A1M4TDQ6_9ACTN|nr:Type 1 glutamine amidotransferase-like domain-containing protein [Ferrithrix thermotolerans]SHE42505.1 cyanophycinase [Ferrithrix thermotolerans DSM 19514]